MKLGLSLLVKSKCWRSLWGRSLSFDRSFLRSLGLSKKDTRQRAIQAHTSTYVGGQHHAWAGSRVKKTQNGFIYREAKRILRHHDKESNRLGLGTRPVIMKKLA